ncbi:DUF3221 domain-containing protein [Lysinibacillus agricola]|uniref:DUF3221 domain-containing protein n=1 Tax=Lysinibacillus agricola TaxID=2590012 RepID=A0ABX7AR99_9BACI|nr:MULTISPECIES: DUF3221 domain-containing protein [Lysinibacillus]QQP12336.1 DUF3221 domain-containing protein [Lysinibacillus agricola]
MRILQATVILLLLFSSLSGCSRPSSDSEGISKNMVSEQSSMSKEPIGTADAEGYIIDKTENSLTIVWYVQQKDVTTKTKKEILDIAKPNALTASYSETNNFEIGDSVLIWTTGKYDDSNPRQGAATKVTLVSKADES